MKTFRGQVFKRSMLVAVVLVVCLTLHTYLLDFSSVQAAGSYKITVKGSIDASPSAFRIVICPRFCPTL